MSLNKISQKGQMDLHIKFMDDDGLVKTKCHALVWGIEIMFSWIENFAEWGPTVDGWTSSQLEADGSF